VRINKANKLTSYNKLTGKKMPKYGSNLQRDVYYLFDKQYLDMKEWAKCSFEIALDEKNENKIVLKK